MKSENNSFAQFMNLVNADVAKYLANQPDGKYADYRFWVKAIILLLSWITLYLFVILSNPGLTWSYIAAILWGLTSMLIVLNIGHDAVHDSVSSDKRINKLLGCTFNIVGGNSYSWMLQHVQSHHPHTNVKGKDFDFDLDPIFRFSPLHKWRMNYRWQHIYFIFIYPLFSLIIICITDFRILSQCADKKYTLWHPLKEWLILIASKLLYFSLVFIIPIYIGHFSLTHALIAFLTINLINGLLLAILFMPSHYFSGSFFYDDNNSTTQINWHERQIRSTLDFNIGGDKGAYTIGAINLGIAHHIFPNFCHIHYPSVANIIRARAKEFQIPLQELSFPQALNSHYLLLKQLSKP